MQKSNKGPKVEAVSFSDSVFLHKHKYISSLQALQLHRFAALR